MKKFIPILLAIVMMLLMIPGVAMAADETVVYMTLSDKGTLAVDKNESVVANVPVRLSGSDQYTLDDALYAFHEQYYNGGAVAGYSVENGILKKVWGDESTNYSCYKNNVFAHSISNNIQHGDNIYIAINKNTGSATECFAWFDKNEVAVATGETVTLAMTKLANIEENIKEPAVGSVISVNGNATPLTTDKNGNVTLSFSKAGTYTVTASAADTSVAFCVITVTGEDKVNAEVNGIDYYRLAGKDKIYAYLSPEFKSDVTEYDLYAPENWYALSGFKQGLSVENGAGYYWSLNYLDGNKYSGFKYTTKTFALDQTASATHYNQADEVRTFSLMDSAGNVVKEYKLNILLLPVIDMTFKVDGTASAFNQTVPFKDVPFSTYDYYVGNDVQKVTLQTNAVAVNQNQDKNLNAKVFVNGQEVNAVVENNNIKYDPVELDLSALTFSEDGVASVAVKVTCSGELYGEHNYTIRIIREPKGDVPVFVLQPKGTEYVAAQGENYTIPEGAKKGNISKPSELSVLASASGEVTYQWYKNDKNSTEGATLIEGATDAKYTPVWNADSISTTTDFYYYCVAKNGDKTAVSDIAKVKVHPTPYLESFGFTEDIPALPVVDGVDFGENKYGFYYIVGDTATPVVVDFSMKNAELQSDDDIYNVSYSVSWNTGILTNGMKNLKKTDSMVVPKVLSPWNDTVTCTVKVNFGCGTLSMFSINYSLDPFYVYVANAIEIEELEDPAAAFAQAWPNGNGTKETPWLLESKTDIEELRDFVNKYNCTFEGKYFKLTDDVDLGEWKEPIGGLKPGYIYEEDGVNIWPFSGTLDGNNKTLTFASGSKPLFGYVREAAVMNFNIYAPYMDGYGLVENYCVDYGADGSYYVGEGGSYVAGCPDTIEITNVTIKEGSVIRESGFLGGYASGGNTVLITNCTVEKGVKIGCDQDGSSANESRVGSFAADFNGIITNSVSYADVYGKDNVGGLVGNKGQAMGYYIIQNSSFSGTVNATGEFVGGISGAGYASESAPNACCATIQNCYVDGEITGANNVGGIFGGEGAVIQCWDNGIGYIRDNHFAGTVKATDGVCGGVIGYMHSLDRYNIIANNYFAENCGATDGIGEVNEENLDLTSPQYGRDDDPLGKDKDALAKAVTSTEMKDGTLLVLLNDSESSFKNWIQDEKYPVHSDKAVAYRLDISGTYKTDYYLGEDIDLTGAVFTAHWSDGTKTTVNSEDLVITGFDNTQRGEENVKVTYGSATAEILVRVLLPDANKITVYFTMYGDSDHGAPTGEKDTHTLVNDNLTLWAKRTAFIMDHNATVKDLVEAAAEKYGFEIVNPTGNYISAIIKDGVTLAEFTNGVDSGWMYTLNGYYPDLGVRQQFLSNNDEVIFHYTDDYTIEKHSYNLKQDEKAASEVEGLIDAIGEVTVDSKAAIDSARAAYDALTDAQKALVENYAALTAAEAKYAELNEPGETEDPKDEVVVVDPSELPFKDIGGWYDEAVAYVYSYGLMNGTSKDGSTFSPDENLNRAMMATILYRIEGEPKVSSANPFTDVPAGEWYTDAIIWAAENKIVEGYGDGIFKPTTDISREQMAAMMYRYAKFKGADVSAADDLAAFNDAATVSDWAKESMKWAVAVDLINGMGNNTLAPQNTATRAQAATVLMRFNENIIK